MKVSIEQLQQEIVKYKQIEVRLRARQDDLERLLKTRTEELSLANEHLCQKIAEKDRIEGHLRQLEQAVENMQLGVTIANLEGEIIYTNQTEAEMHGYDKEELLGQNVNTLAPPELRRPLTLRQISKWKGLIRESVNMRKDGTTFPTWMTTTLLRDDDNNPIGFIGIARDITERKNLEDQLRQSQKMEAIGRLAGGVAHDFNNILTAILGYATLLMKKIPVKDPNYELAVQIQETTDKAAALTRQLLTFSRKQKLNMQVLDINTVIADVEKMLRRLIGEDIELVTALDPSLGKVEADPSQIQQVLLNLAVNARDAMPGGGRLSIETSNVFLDEEYARTHTDARPGPHVMFAVRDTGHGMDDETRSRIFEPFFTTKERDKGTGLGLSTAYGLVKQHRGHIRVFSRPGEDTIFKVYLPCAG